MIFDILTCILNVTYFPKAKDLHCFNCQEMYWVHVQILLYQSQAGNQPGFICHKSVRDQGPRLTIKELHDFIHVWVV